jgi:molybdate transport system substrate-binding protein
MPTANDEVWGRDWQVGVRVWVERDGLPMLGPGRLELLDAVDRWQSISEAARQIGISYRHAWLLIQSTNEAAGESLVIAATGGRRGGGAQLTPRGRAVVGIFRRLQEQLQQTAAGALPSLLHATDSLTVHVAAAVSLEEVLGDLVTAYALRQPAVRVRVMLGASDELADQLLAGTRADLFLSADALQVDRLEGAGMLVPDSRMILAANGLAAIGPADRRGEVRRPADLKRLRFERIALAEGSCPLGSYARTYFEALGIYEQVAERALWVENARAVISAVRSGQAEIGLAYTSDALAAAGCRLLFRAKRLPKPILYTAALLQRSSHLEAARPFLDYLKSPIATRSFRRLGFTPQYSKA